MNPTTTVSLRAVLLVVSALFLVLLFTPRAHAETTVPSGQCSVFQKSFGRGASDARYENAVTQLQQFLSQNGYFEQSLIGTGVFGNKTREALVRYQKANGISPTGYMGPLTRSHITKKWCGGDDKRAVTLINISPSTAQTGTQVSVVGTGFSSKNTVLIDGMVAVRDVPISSTIAVDCIRGADCGPSIRNVITFTLPNSLSPNCPVGSMCPMYLRLLQAGTYKLEVVSQQATSNALPITVVDGSSSGGLSIAGLDAPTSLPIGVSGTWTVRVTNPSTNGTLRYSVLWGDEAVYQSASAFRAPDTIPQQNTATFTHAYRNTGIYSPTFTVTDDSGHSASASASVTVTPIY